MRLFFKETKRLLLPLVIWSAIIGVLLIAEFSSFEGFSSGEGSKIVRLLEYMPKLFLAVFGISSHNVTTLSGFYATIQHYVAICSAIFAIWLAYNAVCRENIDKTGEFLFTRPRRRSAILWTKYCASLFYLLLFCGINIGVSVLSLAIFKIENTIMLQILGYSLSNFYVGFAFFAFTALACSVFQKGQFGNLTGYLVFAASYIICILSDYTDVSWLRYLTPFRVFDSQLLASFSFEWYVLLACTLLPLLLLFLSQRAFNKKNLVA